MAPYTYFADRGIASKKPQPIFGNFGALMFKKESLLDLVENSYNEFKDKRFVATPFHYTIRNVLCTSLFVSFMISRFFGLYEFSKPLLTIRDPELIRQITVKDFEYFVDHRPFLSDSSQEPLFFKSLFLLTGQKWRDMRSTLSPAFTGSKMRQMFQLVVDCSEQATSILLSEAKASTKPFVPEMKDLFTRFTNDVIATAAFGIKVNSLEDRKNEFYMMGRATTDFTGFGIMFRMVLMSFLPKLSKLLGVRMFEQAQADFYHSLVHDTIKHREQNGIVRPDMIHLLMEARKGVLKNDAQLTGASKLDDAGFATVDEVQADALNGTQKQNWDDDDVTAQCFLFFIAGFDTSATLLCFTAHELMENPEVQKKLIEELDSAKELLAGKPLTYEVLQKMHYLDMVVSGNLLFRSALPKLPN